MPERRPSAWDAMASAGRRPAFDSEGRVRGMRSVPGASQSSRDRNIIGIPYGADGGATSKSDWNAFFGRQSPAQPDAWSATFGKKGAQPVIPSPEMTDYRVAGTGVVGGLEPEVPQDASAMANDLDGFQYQPQVESPRQMTADDYLDDVIGSNETWFNTSGRNTSYPESALPGGVTAFKSQYGTGQVKYLTQEQKITEQRSKRLQRLAEEPFQPFADFGLL